MENMEKLEKENISLERLLTNLRKKNNWSYIEVVQKLKNKQINEKTVKKWEYGLEYPDLNMIYELSELYKIPSEEIIKAKNNSFEKGMNSINLNAIKWICYFLNISFYAGIVLMIIFYVAALVLAFMFFMTMAGMVKKT